MQIRRIIIATGNGASRAPMAAELLKRELSGQPIEILSRGLIVQFPEPLNQKAEAVMAADGIVFDSFETKELKNGEIIANNAIIYSLPMPIFSEIHIEKTFSCEGYIDWFEPKDEYYDYSFSECLRSFSVVNFSKSDYIYTFSGNIIQTDDVKEGRVLKVNKSRLKNLTFLYNIKATKIYTKDKKNTNSVLFIYRGIR